MKRIEIGISLINEKSLGTVLQEVLKELMENKDKMEEYPKVHNNRSNDYTYSIQISDPWRNKVQTTTKKEEIYGVH